MHQLSEVFGRVNSDGNVDLLDIETGEAVTRLDANLYPVNSQLSTRYEHAAGIVITLEDAEKTGINIE
ncbi:hypothetical protein MAK22_001968 [Klebsiella aerogenes]|nr:hypothetical protein [Klebsiella aerogenes]EIV7212828.1 hypothetical protein [Klebsiella aerogenes]EKZ5300154.1 hypothetical protein [Klebsiella aerogenes]